MIRSFSCLGAGLALITFSVNHVQAASGTWTNSNGGSWTNTANWLSSVVADAAGNTAFFSTLDLAADTTVTLDAARTIGTLRFADTNPDHNWVLNTGAAGTLTLATSPTINVINQTATVGAVLAGTGGMSKIGRGTLVLTNANTYTGATTVGWGSRLRLDYTGGAASLLNSASTLTLAAGNLYLLGKTSGATAQTLGAVTLSAGDSSITLDGNSGSGVSLTLGALTTSAIGGALNVATTGTGTSAVTTTTGKDAQTGAYGGRVTFNGTDWTTTTSGSSPFVLSAFTGYETSEANWLNLSSGKLVSLAASPSTPLNSTTIAALRQTAASTVTVNSGQTLTLTNGGLLATGTDPMGITGGFLTGTSGSDLVVHQFSASPYTIGSVITDGAAACGLTKAGPGTLVLTAPSTYSGRTTVGSGTLRLSGGANTISPGTLTLAVLPGATLDLNGTSQVLTNLTADAGTVAVNGGALIFTNTWGQIGSAAAPTGFKLTGAGSLVISNGAGRFLFFGGDTRGFSGSIVVASNSAIDINVNSALDVVDGSCALAGVTNAIIQFGGSFTYDTTVAQGGTFDFQPPNNAGVYTWPNVPITLAGPGASKRGAVRFYGDNHQTFPGNFTLTGEATILSQVVGSTATNYQRTLTGTIGGTGDLHLNNYGTTAETVQLNMNGALNHNGGLIVESFKASGGTDRVVLNAANTFSGQTRIANATTRLRLGHAAALQNSMLNLASADAGSLEFSTNASTYTLAGLEGDRPAATIGLTNTSGAPITLVVGGNNQTISYAGGLSGTGQLVKNGSGTLTLAGPNTCAGGYTINAGVLQFGDGSGDYALTGPITNNGGLCFNILAAKTYSGTIAGSGGLTNVGGGTFTLAGTNTYTGPTVVQAGGLIVPDTAVTGTGPILALAGASFGVSRSVATGVANVPSLSVDSGTLNFLLNLTSPNTVAPLNISGGFNQNGYCSVNLLGAGSLAVGTFPLIKYGSYQSNDFSSLVLNSLGSGVTASLQNDPVNHVINLVISALNGLRWTGATDNNWDAATTNWVNTAAGVPSAYTFGGFALFDDSGNNTAINFNFDPQPSGLVVSNVAKAYSFNGFAPLSGTAALVKQGTGTLTVAVNNNNAGGTFIQQGTIQVGDGTIDGKVTTPITDNGSLVFNVLANSTVSGIGGTGTVAKSGSGQLNLGANTYSGATTVQQGKVYVTDSAAFGTESNGTTVQAGSELWIDAPSLVIPEPLVIGGVGVDGTAGALNASANSVASTWSGKITTSATSTVFTAVSGASLALAGGINAGTNTVVFQPNFTGVLTVSSNITAGSLQLNDSGSLLLTAANTLTNVSLLRAVSSSSTPANAGVWAGHSLAFGTNCTIVLTNSDYVGGIGPRVGLMNNVSIPAGVAIVAYCPGDGPVGNGGYRCSLAVTANAGETNIWNGPITIHGADPSLGVNSFFGIYVGNGMGIINSDITVADGVCYLLPRGFSGSANIFRGHINLGTNTLWSTDTTPTVIASTGNTWGVTRIDSGTLRLGTNNALPVTTTLLFNLAATYATVWDLNGFNQQVGGLTTLNAYSTSEGVIENLNATNDSTLTFRSNTVVLFDGKLVGGNARRLGLEVAEGTLALSSPLNSFDGSTLIRSGATLAVTNDVGVNASLLGNLTATTPIDVQAGGTLDVSDATLATFTLTAGRTLTGAGTVLGNLALSGTVSPGDGIGTLSVTGNVTNNPGALTLMEVNNTASASDVLSVSGTLIYGGTLLVTNLSGTPYTNNQVLQLFHATGGYGGAFSSIVFPGVTSYDASQLAVNGTLRVVSVIPTTPTNISFSLAAGGAGLQLSWPQNYTGWRLLAQTNSLSVGLSTNWFTVPGSAATNQMTLPMSPANPAVFYRLVFP